MEVDALAPSPLARYLLELELRRASGTIEIGGREATLHEGMLTEISPAAGDHDFVSFLQAAERLTMEQAEALPKAAMASGGPSLDEALTSAELLDAPTLRETRRALWLDRFVRGLVKDEREGIPVRSLQPRNDPAGPYRVALLPFVLDALMRRAGFGDAECVGHNAGATFEWLTAGGEQVARAARWADFGDSTDARPVSEVLLSHPGAASRIAALVRMGVARLTAQACASDVPPVPPPRPGPSIPPPASEAKSKESMKPGPPQDESKGVDVETAAPTPAKKPEAEAKADASRPPNLPSRSVPSATDRPVLDADGLAPPPYALSPVEPWFGGEGAPIDDPLEPVERAIAAAEQAGAPGPDRAAHWLTFARIADEHYGCVEEAARGAREAAAADQRSAFAHALASRLCASTGQPKLAYAYAKAAAALTQEAQPRAALLRDVGLFALRCGKSASALHALEAAADAGADADHMEHYARALHEAHEVDAALEVALRCADQVEGDDAQRALWILGWAHDLRPEDATLTSAYASLLSRHNLPEAAATALLRAADTCTDLDDRHALQMDAATRAALGDRHDEAAEIWLSVFEESPELSTCHLPLIDSLEAAEEPHEAALVAEEIAGVCAAEQRGSWLLRAAKLQVADGGFSPRLRGLLGRALACPDTADAAWQALGELADREDDPHVVTDALETMLNDPDAPREQKLLAVSRLLTAAGELEAPALLRWAYACRQELDGSHPSDDEASALVRAEQARTDLIVRLESDAEAATPEARGPLLLLLAQLSRDDPQRRIRATKLYRSLLLEAEVAPAAARGLAELLWLSDNMQALILEASQSPGDAHASTLLAGAHAARARGEFVRACDYCLTLLEQHPEQHAEALALLSRAERAGLDSTRAQRAAQYRLQIDTSPRRLARAAMRCSQTLLQAGDVMGALSAAETALSADPRAGRAASLLNENYLALTDDRAVQVLRVARHVLGDPPGLLWHLAQACARTDERELRLEVLDVLMHQSAFVSGPTTERVRVRAQGDDADALAQALVDAFAPTRRANGTAAVVLEGLTRLVELGHADRALEMSVRAADALGESAEPILTWADALSASLEGAPALRSAVLERLVTRLTGDARADALRGLARHERAAGRPAAEVRAWLRLLAISATDSEALSRLAASYGAAGDADRLLSVLTLQLEAATDDLTRAEARLDIAATLLATRPDELPAAREMVRAALSHGANVPENLLRRGVGLLLSRDPRSALKVLIDLAQHSQRGDAGELFEEAVVLAEGMLDKPDLALRTAARALAQVPERTQILVRFERLALRAGEVELAEQVFDALVERAPGLHSHRALLYRKARWLELAGRDTDALTAYVQGFALAPSTGVVLASIERLAIETDRYDALVACLLNLVDVTASMERRLEIYARAANLCAVVLMDIDRALLICADAYRISGSDEPVLQAASFARQLIEADPSRAEALLTTWRSLVREQVSQAWEISGKVRSLVQLGMFAADAAGDQAGTLAAAQEALAAIADDTDEDDGATHADLYALVAALLTRFDEQHSTAVEACDKGLARVPGHQALRALRARLRGDEDGDSPDSGTLPSTRPDNRGEVAVERTADLDALSDRPYAPIAAGSRAIARAVMWAHGGRSRRERRDSSTAIKTTLPPPALAAPVDAPAEPTDEEAGDDTLAPLCDAVLHGGDGTLAALLAKTAEASDAATAVSALLQRIAAEDRLSVEALQALAELGERAGHRALGEVAREALRLGDDPQAPPRSPAFEFEGEAAIEVLSAARAVPPGNAAALPILRSAWDYAAPLFKRTLQSYGVTTNERLELADDHPLAQAFSHASKLTGQSAELYACPTPSTRIEVTVTTPPAILVGDSLDLQTPSLHYRSAVCLERARPENVLITLLPPELSRSMLAALKAAYGPTTSRDSLEREAAAMAAELWRVMPPQVQREVAEQFRSLDQDLEREALQAMAEERAAKVGLLACGHLTTALAHTGLDADAVDGPRIDTLQAALDHPVPRAVVRFALSGPYLRWRAAHYRK